MQSTISNFFGNSTSAPRPLNKKVVKKNKAPKKSQYNKKNGNINPSKDIDMIMAKEIKKITAKKNYQGKEKEYIEGLTEKERYAMFIAYEELETSFNISKSVGYIKWLKNNKLTDK